MLRFPGGLCRGPIGRSFGSALALGSDVSAADRNVEEVPRTLEATWQGADGAPISLHWRNVTIEFDVELNLHPIDVFDTWENRKEEPLADLAVCVSVSLISKSRYSGFSENQSLRAYSIPPPHPHHPDVFTL